MNINRDIGFSLVELMIVVAIIAIIAAFAYPSYKNSVIKTKRAELKAELETITQDIEKQKVAYKRYTAIPVNTLGFSGTGTRDFPSTNNKNYVISVSTDSNNLTSKWVIEAVPDSGGSMKDTGTLKLNFKGEKCWDKNKSGAGTAGCTVSSTSNWDE